MHDTFLSSTRSFEYGISFAYETSVKGLEDMINYGRITDFRFLIVSVAIILAVYNVCCMVYKITCTAYWKFCFYLLELPYSLQRPIYMLFRL